MKTDIEKAEKRIVDLYRKIRSLGNNSTPSTNTLAQTLVFGNRDNREIGTDSVFLSSDKNKTLLMKNEDFYITLHNNIFETNDEVEILNYTAINNPSIVIGGGSVQIWYNKTTYSEGQSIDIPYGSKAYLKCINTNRYVLTIIINTIYSNDEIKTGSKWINDKPIYRIVASGKLDVSDGNESIILTIPDLETVINSYGEIRLDSIFYPIVYSPSSLQYILRNADDFYLYNQDPSTIGILSHYNLTVEYTKTTD